MEGHKYWTSTQKAFALLIDSMTEFILNLIPFAILAKDLVLHRLSDLVEKYC